MNRLKHLFFVSKEWKTKGIKAKILRENTQMLCERTNF